MLNIEISARCFSFVLVHDASLPTQKQLPHYTYVLIPIWFKSCGTGVSLTILRFNNFTSSTCVGCNFIFYFQLLCYWILLESYQAFDWNSVALRPVIYCFPLIWGYPQPLHFQSFFFFLGCKLYMLVHFLLSEVLNTLFSKVFLFLFCVPLCSVKILRIACTLLQPRLPPSMQ